MIHKPAGSGFFCLSLAGPFGMAGSHDHRGSAVFFKFKNKIQELKLAYSIQQVFQCGGSYKINGNSEGLVE